MGGSSSTTKMVNEHVTNVISKVMIKHSTSCSGTVAASQIIIASGKDSVVKGVKQSQAMKISLKCMGDSTVNSQMQADLLSTLMNDIKQSASNMPVQFSNSDQNVDIENKIKSNIESQFSHQVFAEMNAGINLEQKIVAELGGKVEDAVQEQCTFLSGHVRYHQECYRVID